jgi:hypothetical protein
MSNRRNTPLSRHGRPCCNTARPGVVGVAPAPLLVEMALTDHTARPEVVGVAAAPLLVDMALTDQTDQ